MHVVLGTRGSPLALAQTRWVLGMLRAVQPQTEFEVREVKTQGDIHKEAPLGSLPRGLFAKELEDALLRGEIDIAIHSFKDLPVEPAAGTAIAAISRREDARDVLVSARYSALRELPQRARLGTSSARRAAQLRGFRPDLEMMPIRGNLGTRVKKSQEDGLDGIVLAAAGLKRLGLAAEICEYIDPAVCLPEAGQGALGLQTREKDAVAIKTASACNDSAVRMTVMAEVAVVRVLGGGCTLPIAAYGALDGEEMLLRGMVANASGSQILRSSRHGPSADYLKLGESVAQALLEQGAETLLKERRS